MHALPGARGHAPPAATDPAAPLYRTTATSPWLMAVPLQSAQRDAWCIDTLPGISARYVRVFVFGSPTGGTQARELQVFGQ